GKEAVEAMTKEYYDIIFMDIQMPVMSGIEATHRIREKDSKALNPKAPIIAFTANAMEGDRETYEKEGMDDYVSKPVNKHEIEAILEKWTVSK
ncbi:MAG: response regulator, partial [Bacteroidota bacterium]|nr:response regulator [Bacteroidota bacterium]